MDVNIISSGTLKKGYNYHNAKRIPLFLSGVAFKQLDS